MADCNLGKAEMLGLRVGTLLIAAILGLLLAIPSSAFAAAPEGSDAQASSSADSQGGGDASEQSGASATEGQSASNEEVDGILVSAEGEAALAEGSTFGLNDFSRAQRGSNRDLDGAYLGYTYYQGSSADCTVAAATDSYVVVYVPESAASLCNIEDEAAQDQLKRYFIALDEQSMNGGIIMDDSVPWYFTSEKTFTQDGIVYNFAVEVEERYYVSVIGEDGSDVVSDEANADIVPTHVDFATVAAPDAIDIQLPATGLAALGEFLGQIDFSPLWVTLRTTGVAIVFIFILGLAAAYFSLRIPKRAQDIADAIFTIPMVLPPTVCGFLLLLALGNNSPIGSWFIDVGFPLIFSWPATVIAAVVVAFPLMYRNARGAFEGLDPNMLDAARTLGWSNWRIFFKLMLPLSWSSIAAGTVLSFARALGEFGCTLFLAGNYVGITRTIPIAIYFEWMSGNIDEALFWTLVVLVFSFIVILFINLWSRRTTKYRRGSEE